jgi:Peptidase family M23
MTRNNLKRQSLIVCVALLAASSAPVIHSFTPFSESAQAVSCNWSSSKPLPWNVAVRADKTTASPSIGKKLAGQVLSFEAWEDGQTLNDAWTAKPDSKWFKLKGEPGWVASAVIPGYPPSNCQQSSGPVNNVSRDTPYLPFDAGTTLTVSQAYNGSHVTADYAPYTRYAVDFAAVGKRVGARASRYGQVVYAGWKAGGYGNVVVVKYNDGKYGRYMHLAEVWTKTGDWVVGGRGLGLVGSTGNSTATHLHYAEALSDFGPCIELPKFADAPNANFNQSNFSVTSQNPDGRG